MNFNRNKKCYCKDSVFHKNLELSVRRNINKLEKNIDPFIKLLRESIEDTEAVIRVELLNKINKKLIYLSLDLIIFIS